MKEQLISSSTREIQQVELDIVMELQRICIAMQINFQIFSGTLLGAVRHRGFIPWDDDIDVIMLRSDYNKFIKNAPKIISKQFFIQTFETDPEFPLSFCKIRDTNTTFIEEDFLKYNINHGIYIDIFPMDNIPDNHVIRKVGWMLLSTLGKFALVKSIPNERRKIKNHILIKIIETIPLSSQTIFLVYNKLNGLMVFKKSKNIAFTAMPYDSLKHIIYPREWFEKSIHLEFEGTLLPAPSGYHHILRHLYNNYMEIPSEEKRVGHRNVIARIDIPYEQIVNNIN